ncbi:MAG: methyltransferase [Nitrospirales bacterium]|nr:MAG: methyltransferase [Nitrospirales bacterium]
MQQDQPHQPSRRDVDVVKQPSWLTDLLDIPSLPCEGEVVVIRGIEMMMIHGILRSKSIMSESQEQTKKTFGFKWHQRNSFEGNVVLANMRAWLIERYGNVAHADWLREYGESPLILDAGCGAAMSALELFNEVLGSARYLGVDISTAVDVASVRFAERGLSAGFVQSDLTQLPFAPCSFDIIFSEGVLHHTDSTEHAFFSLANLLKPGGRFLFYVYQKKGPVREFTDDHIRAQLQGMTSEQAWEAMVPLTKLGQLLGELNIEIDVPEPIDLLNIPAGKIDLQRFFYWHVCKAYYRPDMMLDEMNHINFDWYAPRNAHRHTIDEVRTWCARAGFTIEREQVQEAGITIIGKKDRV